MFAVEQDSICYCRTCVLPSVSKLANHQWPPSLHPPCRLLDRLAGRALRLLACAVKTDLGDLADYDGSERHRGGQLGSWGHVPAEGGPAK